MYANGPKRYNNTKYSDKISNDTYVNKIVVFITAGHEIPSGTV